MTQSDYFSYVAVYPNSLNVWYDEGGPPHTIRAVSIPVLETNGESSKGYLERVEEVSIPLSGGSESRVTLEVLSRIYGLSIGIEYYILLVKPLTVLSIGDTTVRRTTVLLSPAIDIETFADSPYNVIGGLVEDARDSVYIMQSDRYKVGTLSNPTYTGPLNIDALLSGSATKASVQDSNYSSIGWTRSRYDGAKTNRIDYKVDPALAGRLFQGADFASGSDRNQINYLISSSQVEYKDFFYAGKGDVPGLDLSVPTGLRFIANPDNPSSYPADETGSLWVSSKSLTVNPTYYPIEGDIIVVNPLTIPELMKITNVEKVSDNLPVTYSLDLVRGYYTDSAPIAVLADINRANPVQIYNIDNNKLSGVPKGVIVVKETGKTLGIDPLGYVVYST